MKLSIIDLLIIPLKHKLKIIIINTIVGLVALGLLLLSIKLPPEISFMPDMYTSEAKLFLPVQDDKVNINSMQGLTDNFGLRVDKRVRPEKVILNILQTNTVLDGVIEQFVLPNRSRLKKQLDLGQITKEDLRNYVRKSAYFSSDVETGFIYIGYTDINPWFARGMVDTFLEMSNKATFDFALTQTTLKKRFIEDRVEEINEKLEIAKKQYIDFQQTYGMISPEYEAEQISKTISNLRNQLIAKEAELDKYERIHHSDSIEIKQTKFEVENLRSRIEKLTKGSKKKKGEFVISKSAISELSLEYDQLKRNVENLENIYTSLLNELEIAQIQEKSEGPMMQVLDPPEVPTKKSGPSRSKLLFQIMIMSLLLTIGIPVCMGALKQFISQNDELKDKMNILLKHLWFNKRA